MTVDNPAGTKTPHINMGPEPIFSWNGEGGTPEFYLHGRAPSCVQATTPELKVQGS